MPFVRVDDLLYERMADDVRARKVDEGEAAHARKYAFTFDQPAFLPAREIDLSDIAGDHRLGAETDPRQKHLHLLRRRVLRLVENDERMVERAAAHVRERRQLDRVALEELGRLVEAHQVVERVVQRTQIRIYLLREIAGQESEPFARFHCGTYEHDPLDGIALERIDRARDSEVGFAGYGW